MAEAMHKQISCLHCDFKSYQEQEFLRHVKCHRYDPRGIKLPCFKCAAVLGSFRVHTKHMKNCQKPLECEEVEKNLDTRYFWQCDSCEERFTLKRYPNLKDFKTVTKHVAKHINREVVKCPAIVEDRACLASFHLYQSFNNHINKHQVLFLIVILMWLLISLVVDQHILLTYNSIE